MKKLFLLIMCMVMAVLFINKSAYTQLPSYVPTDSLKGWWSFTGNANDLSGNNINGTVNGATLTSDRHGNTDCAYYFDGTNDWIDFGDNDLLNSHLTDITVSAWIKTSSPYSRIFSKGTHGGTQPGYAIMLYPSTGGKAAVIFSPGGHEHNLTRSNNLVNNNTWHMITGVIHRKGDAELYVDGVKQTLTVPIAHDSLIDVAANTYNATAGVSYCNLGTPNSLMEFYQGYIDEIGVWKRALTSCEIKRLYKESLSHTTIYCEASSSYTAPDGSVYNSSGIYAAIIPDIEGCDSIITIELTVNNLPINIHDLIPTSLYEKVSDANTIVLDHFNNSSIGELHTTLSYVDGICGLNNAAEFKNNNWLRYGYNANLRDAATFDFWIYPKAYSTPLVDINWSNSATSYPGSGHVFHLDITSSGNISMSNWPGTGLGILVSNESLPLNKWTHVAVCWGDSTIIYLNGEQDIASPLSFRPSASGSYSIYVPKWGTANQFYLDEFQVSNKRRNLQEIRSGYSYLNVMAETDSLCENSSTNILLANPQSGVSYQLLNGGAAQGSPQIGNCDTLVFPTGNLLLTSHFTIEATDTATLCSTILDTILTITVHPNFELIQDEDICQGAILSWRGDDYSVQGIYYDSLLSEFGCDSVYVLNLMIHPHYEFQIADTICGNSVYTWRGDNYSTTGTYYDSLLTQYGCDSIYVLHLNVHPVFEFSQNTAICQGSIFTWRGDDYSLQGTYYDSLMTQNDCDSVYILNLTLNPSYEFTTVDTICDGTVYSWRGNNYNTSGTYYNSFLTQNGCDSVYILELHSKFCPGQLCDWMYYNKITVNNTSNPENLTDYSVLVIVRTDTLISQGKMKADGSDIRFTTNFVDNLEYWIEPGIQNEYGMDDDSTHIWVKIPYIAGSSSSTMYMYYGNVAATAKSSISNTFIFGDDFDDNSANLSKWQLSYDNLGQMLEQNQRLEHNSPKTTPESRSRLISKTAFTGPIVLEMQFKKGGYVYRGAGFYQAENQSQNVASCTWQDWGPFGAGVDVNGSSVSYTFRNDTWSRSYNPEYYLKIYRKQDSTFKFVEQIPSFEPDGYKYWEHSFVSPKMPLNTPLKILSYENVWVGASPLWIRHEDNIRVRKLSEPEPQTIISSEMLISSFEIITSDTICAGDIYPWRGDNYSSTGTYYDSLLTQYGCDSVYILNLLVNPVYEFEQTAHICQGEVFSWRGDDFSASGTYYDSLLTQYGCDSIYVLHLNVHPVFEFSQNTAICQGSIFTWRGDDYSLQGTYYDSLMTQNDCDSVYILNLTLNPSYEFTTVDTICDGTVYSWRGNNYNTSGTYYNSFLTQNGCDSVYILELHSKFCPGQLCDWMYYNKITVNNTSNPENLTDYSVLVIVRTDTLISQGKMKADGSDIRFTTNFVDNLEYWIEPGIQNEYGMDDDSTHIWVKIPYIAGSSSSTMYMYYGNVAATAKSSISNTFIFGDDFDDNSANLSKWQLSYDNLGQMLEQNQRLEHNSPKTTPESRSRLISKTAFTGPIVLEMQFKKGGYVYRGAGFYQAENQSQNVASCTWQDWGPFGAGVDVNGSSVSYTFRNDTWSRSYNPEYYLKIYRKQDSTFKFVEQIPSFEPDGYKYWEHSFVSPKMPLNTPLKVLSYENVWVGASPLWIRYEDNIRVRKLSEPEPQTIISSETNINSYEIVTDDSICDGEIYLWRGDNYASTGTYYDSLLTQNGCDSVFVLNLIVHPLPNISVSPVVICEGETATLTASGGVSYEWSTGSLTNPLIVNPITTTTYSVTGTNVNLCSDSTQVVVTVNPLPLNIFDLTATKILEKTPDANTIVLDHFNNSSVGVLHNTLTYVDGICGLNNAAEFKNNNWLRYGYNANLRDAATFDFWIYPKAYSTPLVDINWSNTATSYPGSGHVFHLDITPSGNLSMSNWPGTGLGILVSNESLPLNKWTHVAVCWGDSTIIYLNGEQDIASPLSFRPSASGSYSIYVPKWGTANQFYLDEFHVSNKRRNLQEITSGYSYLNVMAETDTLCENSSTNILLANPQSGVSYQLLNGGAAQGSPQIGNCDTLVFPTGNLLLTSHFTIEATDTATLCSIILDTILTITVNAAFELSFNEEICFNEPLIWHGNTYNVSGTYYDSLITPVGCDSIYILNLIVHPSFEQTITVEICAGEFYNWHGANYSVSGLYYDSLVTSFGCDSVFILNLKVHPDFEFVQTEQICQGEVFAWRGDNYSVAGTYYDSLLTQSGCDSVFVLNLSVNPVFSSTANHAICQGEVFAWRGDNYTVAGTYYDSLLTQFGCDSVFVLNLSVNPVFSSTANHAICQGEVFTWRGDNYTVAGTYYDSLLTQSGCDSVFVLNLSVNPVFSSTANHAICQGEFFAWRGDNYTVADTYYDSLLTQSGCDSVFVLNLSVNPVFSSTANHAICQGDVFAWRGDNYTVAGTYYDSLLTQSGCDSVFVLNLSVNPVFSSTANHAICQGDVFAWRGDNYTVAGTYYDSLLTQSGCDSVFILHLQTNPHYEIIENSEICQGSSLNWHGTNYTTQGTYYDSLLTQSGCDSVFVLNLVINPVIEFNQTEEICNRDSLFWRGDYYYFSGIYYDSLQSTSGGCDSVYILNLTVYPSYEFTQIESICTGGFIFWRGNNYSTQGLFADSMLTVDGCDSVYLLNLTVFDLPIVNISGLNNFYCTYNSAVSMTGTPTGGTFSGQGVSGNTFSPSNAGLGFWTVYYTYADTNTCVNTDSVIVEVDACVGISDKQTNRFRVYPNPNDGSFYIEILENTQIHLYNSLGSLIYSNSFEKGTHALTFAELPAGVYFLKAEGNNTLDVVRVIVWE
ncbi:MAG: DUF2341 domain-containing protein [Bacteroidales bacterium]|nr:DUF2341 domain-containing protein [Bacteroidales bacterium]